MWEGMLVLDLANGMYGSVEKRDSEGMRIRENGKFVGDCVRAAI